MTPPKQEVAPDNAKEQAVTVLLHELSVALEDKNPEAQNDKLKSIVSKATQEQLNDLHTRIESGANVPPVFLKAAEREFALKLVSQRRENLKAEVEASKGLIERVTDDVQGAAKDLKEGGTGTWLKYGGLVAGGAFVAKWVWDHTIGWLWEKTAGEGGWFSKLMSGLAFAGGALGGLMLARGKGSGLRGLLPDWANKGLDGGERAIDKTMERSKEIREGFERGDVVMIVVGGVKYMWKQGTDVVYTLNQKFWDEVMQGNYGNAFGVHVEGTIIYACSFGALQAFNQAVRGNLKGIPKAFAKSLVWQVTAPYDAVRAVQKTAGGVQKGVRGVQHATETAEWVIRDGKLFWKTKFGAQSEAHLAELGNRWGTIWEKMRGLPPDSARYKEWLRVLNSREGDIKTVLMAMQRDIGSGQTHHIIERMYGSKTAEQVRNALAMEEKGIFGKYWNGKALEEIRFENIADVLKKGTVGVAQATDIIKELQAGKKAIDLIKGGMPLQDFLKAIDGMEPAARAGILKELLKEGIVLEDLLKAGAKAGDILKAGQTVADVAKAIQKFDKAARVSIYKQLLQESKSVASCLMDLRHAGAAFDELLKAGGNAEMLLSMGAKAEDFVSAGKTAAEWKAAGGAAEEFAKAERAATAAPKAPKATPKEAPKAPKGPARPAEQILKEAKEAKTLRGAQLTETLRELQRTGKFPALTDEVIHAVSNGGAKAERIAAGYLKTGDATDIVKLGKSFGKAARTSIPSGLLGIGGDAFGVWVAYNDLQENYKNIEEARKTGNTELRQLYETATIVNKVEIGLYTASAALQFAGFFWAAAAGASVVAIPVTLVVGLGAMGYKEIHGNLERWLREAKDWMKFPPETLMKCLMEHSDETLMQQVSSLGNAGQFNNSTRWNICKAYIALTSKVTKHPDEEADGEEGDRRFRQREAEYLEDQLGYISWATNRTYKFADPFIFEQARTHARLTASGRQARELKEKGFTAPLTMKIKGRDGKDREVDLAEYGSIESDPAKPDYQEKRARMMHIAADTTETQEGELLTELAALAKKPAEFARHAPAMIVGMMRDSIAFIEGKILKWDDTFSGSARRWWNSDVAVSRGFIADQLKNGINAIIAAVVQGKDVSVGAMAKHIEGLRALLRNTDPNSKLPPQMERNRAYYESIGRDAQLLTPQGVTKLINDYPIIAPEASESPDQPTPIVALIAHATPVNTHSHVREIKIKANKQGVVNVNGLQGWHYDAVKEDGTLHMFKNSLDNQHAVPKGRFLFWQPVHTPHVNKAELMLIVE
jgi:hypothetical protein